MSSSLSIALALAAAAALTGLGVTARADGDDAPTVKVTMHDTLSPHDIKAILEQAKSNDSTPPGVDVAAGTVRFTNAERTRLVQFTDELAQGGDGYAGFAKACGTHPTIVYEGSIVKLFGPGEALPIDQTLEGFSNACINPPNPIYKAFIGKIKTIHFTMYGVKCRPTHDSQVSPSYEMQLDEHTGELVIGVGHYECANIAQATLTWIAKQ